MFVIVSNVLVIVVFFMGSKAMKQTHSLTVYFKDMLEIAKDFLGVVKLAKSWNIQKHTSVKVTHISPASHYCYIYMHCKCQKLVT